MATSSHVQSSSEKCMDILGSSGIEFSAQWRPGLPTVPYWPGRHVYGDKSVADHVLIIPGLRPDELSGKV